MAVIPLLSVTTTVAVYSPALGAVLVTDWPVPVCPVLTPPCVNVHAKPMIVVSGVGLGVAVKVAVRPFTFEEATVTVGICSIGSGPWYRIHWLRVWRGGAG